MPGYSKPSINRIPSYLDSFFTIYPRLTIISVYSLADVSHCIFLNPRIMFLFAYLLCLSLTGQAQHATCLHNGSSIALPRIIADRIIMFIQNGLSVDYISIFSVTIWHFSLKILKRLFLQCTVFQYVHVLHCILWINTAKVLLKTVPTPYINYNCETHLYRGLKAGFRMSITQG